MLSNTKYGLIEKYSSADTLLAAIRTGWKISRLIYSEDFQRRNSSITVYYFELARGDETVNMAVVGSPSIIPLVKQTLAQENHRTMGLAASD